MINLHVLHHAGAIDQRLEVGVVDGAAREVVLLTPACLLVLKQQVANLIGRRGDVLDKGSGGTDLLAADLPMAVVGYFSALHQAKAAAAGVGIVAKKPNESGKAITFAALVETYAILALLVSVLALNGLTGVFGV